MAGSSDRLVRVAVCSACLVLCLFAVPGCSRGESAQSPVVIGYLGPLSGRSSGLGLAGRDGALLAVEEANAAGGLDGRSIRLVAEDDGGGATATISGLEALDKQGAIAVVGPLTSASAQAAVPVADRLGMPLLSPTVSSTDFGGKDDAFLRTCADNKKYADQLAERVLERSPRARVALAYDTGNLSYTQRLAEHFATAIQRGGGSVVATATFESGKDPDYHAVAQNLVAASPDAVFIVANSIDSGLLCQRVRGTGFKETIALSHWAATGDLLGSGGRAVDGAIFMDNWDRTSSAPEFTGFVERFEKRFKYPVTFAAIHSYDATRMLLEAAKGDSSRTAVKRKLIESGPFQGVQDAIEISAAGDCDRPFYPMTIRDGAFVAETDR